MHSTHKTELILKATLNTSSKPPEIHIEASGQEHTFTLTKNQAIKIQLSDLSVTLTNRSSDAHYTHDYGTELRLRAIKGKSRDLDPNQPLGSYVALYGSKETKTFDIDIIENAINIELICSKNKLCARYNAINSNQEPAVH